MCTSPLLIKNPSKFPSEKFSKERFNVPCGSCLSCQIQQKHDWFFRAYYHFKQYVDSGGFVCFPTLTFNNNHLPKIYYHGKVFPVFDNLSVRSFIKTLRERVRRKYSAEISYFICPEYGQDDRYTHRPHYHCLFFCPSCISRSWFISSIIDIWHLSMHMGFVGWSRTGKCIDSFKGIKYVAKYSTKQVSYYNYIHELITEYVENAPDDLKVERRKFLNSFLPRRMVCHGFGKHFLNFFITSSTSKQIDMVNHGVSISGDFSQSGMQNFYTIPRYLQLKLFYDIEKHETFDYRIPSEYYKSILQFKFDNQYNNNVKFLQRALDFSGVRSMVYSLPESFFFRRLGFTRRAFLESYNVSLNSNPLDVHHGALYLTSYSGMPEVSRRSWDIAFTTVSYDVALNFYISNHGRRIKLCNSNSQPHYVPPLTPGYCLPLDRIVSDYNLLHNCLQDVKLNLNLLRETNSKSIKDRIISNFIESL